jgi:hypothetical protein
VEYIVFTAMHYIPSAISTLLVIFLATRVRPHRGLARTPLPASDLDAFALQENVSAAMPEVEAQEYQGKRLIPLNEQGNNAIEVRNTSTGAPIRFSSRAWWKKK